MFILFFCKRKTAYVWRSSDWSSDVCSSDLPYRSAVRAPRQPRNVLVQGLQVESAPDVAPDVLDGRRREISHPRPGLRLVQCREELIGVLHPQRLEAHMRTQERRIGKQCVIACRSRWAT